jgi:hypothetical protein
VSEMKASTGMQSTSRAAHPSADTRPRHFITMTRWQSTSWFAGVIGENENADVARAWLIAALVRQVMPMIVLRAAISSSTNATDHENATMWLILRTSSSKLLRDTAEASQSPESAQVSEQLHRNQEILVHLQAEADSRLNQFEGKTIHTARKWVEYRSEIARYEANKSRRPRKGRRLRRDISSTRHAANYGDVWRSAAGISSAQEFLGKAIQAYLKAFKHAITVLPGGSLHDALVHWKTDLEGVASLISARGV